MIHITEEIKVTKIYLVTNCYGDPNKVYIGKEKSHKNTKREYNHKCKFGKQIEFTYIDEIEGWKSKNWKPLETYWIQQFIAWGFEVLNIRKIGGNGPEFQTEETKLKISKSNKGKPKPEGFGEQFSKDRKGKLRPEMFISILQYDLEGNFIKEWESINKAAEYMNICSTSITSNLKQRTKSSCNFQWKYKTENYPLNINKIQPDKPRDWVRGEELKNKISKANKGKIKFEKSVLQYDKQGNFIKEFRSINEASKSIGLVATAITQNLKGRSKFSGGFIWKYKN